MKRGLSLLLLMVLGVGCVAPQSPGAERTAYLSMATASGAVGGAVGIGLTCSVARYGLAHKPPSGVDATDKVCMISGAVVGAAASFYGSSESEDEPGLEHWAVVSLGAAAAAAIVAGIVIDLFD